jgi:hypothetical protein
LATDWSKFPSPRRGLPPPELAGGDGDGILEIFPNHLIPKTPRNKLKRSLQEVLAPAGKLYVFADADTHIESGPGIQALRVLELFGELSHSSTSCNCICRGMTRAVRSARGSISRAIWQSR